MSGEPLGDKSGVIDSRRHSSGAKTAAASLDCWNLSVSGVRTRWLP